MKQYKRKEYSTVEYILLSLIPYSRPNLMLAYKPNAFFNELERISRRKKPTLQSSLSKAIRSGYIKRINGVPVLSKKGRQKVSRLNAKRLKKDVYLMVAFDIPEELRAKRRRLRAFLKFRDFRQAQKSIWISPFDHSEEIKSLIDELQIGDFVDIYECAQL